MRQMTLSALLTLQMRVILSLVLRETRATFGTSAFGYAWAVITPTASVAVLVILFSLVGRHAPFGSSLALFFATGILTLQFFTEISGKLMTVFDANRALLTYPVIKDVDTVLARALLISATYLVIMLLFYAGLILCGMADFPAQPEQLVYVFLATALLGLGYGTVNAVIASLWDTWIQIERVLTRPLFFISGIFYIPSQLPKRAQDFLAWNPVLHLVEWFRCGFYPNYDSRILDIGYPLFVGTGLLLAGLAGERLFRRARF
ncbi:capsular polysaccharide transport system permease protein [Yoonia tamlensis]|uniref:Capsular polysaccharide transport system permease protein n=1 Tax=Yoonia tamlensis TaxID=390270 RepID=A0A1I6HFF8_9RHOB|nr:ABC transporter permease [Yoonia tamlensis]SFR53098.1 capsular polysaccharide transport system permease protein [Yoonia tamlensis]